MKLTDSCTIILDKGKNKKKIKCYKVFATDLNRYIAIHPNIDYKDKRTSITDIETGLKLFDIEKPFEETKQEEIDESMDNFIKHYTLEAIQARAKEILNKGTLINEHG